MARRGGKRRDPAREKFWRRTIREQQRSGLAVRTFCLREGLKDCTFRWWRKELARRDHLYRDGHRLAGSPGLDSQIGILRLVHYTDLGGYRIAPQILLPFGRLDGRHDGGTLGDRDRACVTSAAHRDQRTTNSNRYRDPQPDRHAAAAGGDG